MDSSENDSEILKESTPHLENQRICHLYGCKLVINVCNGEIVIVKTGDNYCFVANSDCPLKAQGIAPDWEICPLNNKEWNNRIGRFKVAVRKGNLPYLNTQTFDEWFSRQK